MGLSKIEWTDRVWNPIRGCSRVSAGCQNCYGERMAARFASPAICGGPTENGDYEGGRAAGPFYGFAKDGHWTGRVELIPSKLEEPLHWKKQRRVFVDSMSDLFHEALSAKAIGKVFAVMALCPQHTFQILTKRPERMREYLSRTQNWVALPTRRTFPRTITAWPLPNVWLGVSCENQDAADKRIPLLLQTPAAKKFVSLEPLLSAIDIRPWLPPNNPHLDWVIVGGES